MIILRKALQHLSILGLIASPLLSAPAAADATTGVGKFRTSGGGPRILLTDLSQASAFLLGKPGSSSALGFESEDCSSNKLTMARLDLTSSFQMWKYDSSTSTIQSIACPGKVITISNSSCNLVEVSLKGLAPDSSQEFSFTIVGNLSDDETIGVTFSSSAVNCDDKFLSDGGSANGSIGKTIQMRENDETDKWIIIDLSIGNNYFHYLRDYPSKYADPSYAASISMSSNGNRIAISGSEQSGDGNNVFTGFVKIFDADNDKFVGIVRTKSIEATAPIVNVVLSGNGDILAVGTVFPTNGSSTSGEALSSGVQVYDLTNINGNDEEIVDIIGGPIVAGAIGDLPGLRLDMSDDGSTLVVGGRNYGSGRGRARLYRINKSDKTITPFSGVGFEGDDDSEDHLGSSVSLSGNGEYVAIGGTGVVNNNDVSSGAVKVYDTDNNELVGNVIYGTAANDATGFSVDLVVIGSSIYVAVASIFEDSTDGSSDRGKVEIFTLENDEWTRVGKSLVGDRGATLDFLNGKYHIGDSLGFSLGLAKMRGDTGGLRVAVGSPFFSNVRESDAYYGVVKLFEYNIDAQEWKQIAYDIIGNSKTSASGTSIALVNGGDILAIGGGPDGASNGEVVVYAQEETSSQPSSIPSIIPSKEPSKEPSSVPSFQPSSIPSDEPSSVPSSPPSSVPSKEPSSSPSSVPSSVPSSQPSSFPSKEPSSAPSNVPSTPPSSVPSEKPSSAPSNVPSSQPSFVPSQHPSDTPSTRPSISHKPSSQPSTFGDRQFMILSKFKKFTDLPMDSIEDRNWCLERLFSTSAEGGHPLKMRPCDIEEDKQIWFYETLNERQDKVITSGPETQFCITRNGKQLVAKTCDRLPAAVDTILSEGAMNLSLNGSTGSISMKTDKNEFYFAIDSIRIFSRVKLLKKGTENSSFDKWQLRYHGPSEFPSSIPSSSPSKKPSTGPSSQPSTRPSAIPSSSPSKNSTPSKKTLVPSTLPSMSIRWTQVGTSIRSPNGVWFGYGIERTVISADGKIVAVGDPREDLEGTSRVGSVQVYRFSGGDWVPLGRKIWGSTRDIENFGRSVALSHDGSVLAIGASHADSPGTNTGHAWVYDLIDDEWELRYFTRGTSRGYDYLGTAISLSDDGNTMVTSAPGYSNSPNILGTLIFDIAPGDVPIGSLVPYSARIGEYSNYSTLSGSGKVMAVSSYKFTLGNKTNCGRIRVYSLTDDGSWELTHTFHGVGTNSNLNFVKLSQDGSIIAMSQLLHENGQIKGLAQVFQSDISGYVKRGGDIITNVNHPYTNAIVISLSGDGDTLAIGTSTDNENSEDTSKIQVYHWSENKYSIVGDYFQSTGTSYQIYPSLSQDGKLIALGFHERHEIRVFELPALDSPSSPFKKPSTVPSSQPSTRPIDDIYPPDLDSSWGANPDTSTTPLGLCSGDCDGDDDCDEGLVCFQRNGFTPVPGCTGSGIKMWDYCVEPRDEYALKRSDTTEKHGLCTGNCDGDDDCDEGLVCFEDGTDDVPGCTGVAENNMNYCVNTPGLDSYAGADQNTSTTPLGLCSGDCDGDDDCEEGLVCFQRDGFTSVPGCSGIKVEGWDYCVESNYEYELKGTTLDPDEKLGLCTGDCDRDDDCVEGLVCFQRAWFTPVPGCTGVGVAYFDYCINPPSSS